MNIILIDSKIELTMGIHLLRFSKSFLDLPCAAWDLALLIYLLHSSKRAQKCARPHVAKFPTSDFCPARQGISVSETGDGHDDHSFEGIAVMATPSPTGVALNATPWQERHNGCVTVLVTQPPRQCAENVSLSRNWRTGSKLTNRCDSDHDQGNAQHQKNPVLTDWVSSGFSSRMVTKRVRLVESAYRLGSKSADAHAVCDNEVTLTALLPFASLVSSRNQVCFAEAIKVACGKQAIKLAGFLPTRMRRTNSPAWGKPANWPRGVADD